MAKEYYEFDTESGGLRKMDKKENAKADKAKSFLSRIDKWALFKQVVSVAAGGCASVMVNKYLHASLPEAKSTTEKVVTGVGVYFVTGVVAEKVSEYASSELDEWKESVLKLKVQEQSEASDIVKEAVDNGGN